MFGLTGVLIALIALTIVLAGVFLVRPSVTAGATGKILAFIGLCVLPALCIGTGMSFHMQRSQQTAYCISCHSMETHGESLHVLDPSYIPAQHFQNHFVPPDKACYTCHTDYTIYGPWKSRLKGLRFIYLQYVSTPPKVIHLAGRYSNLQCLHCHEGARDFEKHLNQMPPIAELTSNHISCISSGCHDTIHNVSEVGHLKMWNGGPEPTSTTSEPSSPPPATAKPVTAAPPTKTPAGSTAGKTAATAAGGKAIFDSHGCSGCHGVAGGGGTGPALTHISSHYTPAKLTAVLKAPNAKMKAAGMVPLTLNAADMKALVAYVSSLGGASPASAEKQSASRAPSPAPAKGKPAAAAEAAKAASPATPSASGAASPAPASAKPSAAAAPSKGPPGGSAGAATAQGKSIFVSQRCSGCHGATGGGGAGPALTHISSKYPPAALTALLKAPRAKMKAAGMVPLTLNAADMKALVSYVSSLGGASASSAATSSASGSSSPALTKEESEGATIFKAHGCAGCHGVNGAGGTAAAPALAGTTLTPALLTTMLQHPTAAMQRGGMPPQSLTGDDLKALVAYVSSISASKSKTQ